MSRTVSFTVPHLTPPSVNHAHKTKWYTDKDGRSYRGRGQTDELKAYKAAVAIFAHGDTVAPLTDRERREATYVVRIDIYLGPRQHGDFDNFWKAGLDAIVNCGVIHTDACVDGEHSRCVVHKEDRDNPRTEYQITYIPKRRTNENR